MKCNDYHWRNRLDARTMECRRFPPQVTVLMTIRQGLMQQRPEQVPTPFCAFPLVQPDQFCGEWRKAGTQVLLS